MFIDLIKIYYKIKMKLPFIILFDFIKLGIKKYIFPF